MRHLVIYTCIHEVHNVPSYPPTPTTPSPKTLYPNPKMANKCQLNRTEQNKNDTNPIQNQNLTLQLKRPNPNSTPQRQSKVMHHTPLSPLLQQLIHLATLPTLIPVHRRICTSTVRANPRPRRRTPCAKLHRPRIILHIRAERAVIAPIAILCTTLGTDP
jgi:hypothetical protein